MSQKASTSTDITNEPPPQQQPQQQAVDVRMEPIYKQLVNEIMTLANKHQATTHTNTNTNTNLPNTNTSTTTTDTDTGRDTSNTTTKAIPPPLWVGIAGPPGAGKTTLTSRVALMLNSQGFHTVVIPMDGYHYYKAELDKFPDPVTAHARRGSPYTFNASKFLSDLLHLRVHGIHSFPSFDHHKGDPIEHDIHVDVRAGVRVIMVEGNYLLLKDVKPWDSISCLFDVCYFIHASLDTIRTRVAVRHMSTGNTSEQAWTRVNNNDGPNAELVLTTAKYANHVIESV